MGAKKRFDKIANRVRQFLKTGSKKDLKQVKDELVKFISSTNVYDQALYSDQQSEIKSMLTQLENYEVSKINQPTKADFFCPEVIIPSCLGAVLVAMIAIVIVKRKRKQKVKVTF